MVDDCTAQDIYQHLLDTIGCAIRDRDFHKYSPHFTMPSTLETFDRTIQIKDKASLKRLFDDICRELDVKSVHELTRNCTMAEFVDATTIRGNHETRMITPQNTICGSYIALSTLEKGADGWQVATSQYASSENSLPDHLILRQTESKRV